MSWTKKTENGVEKTAQMEYDKLKKELLPVALKEADSGIRPFDPMVFQAVQSPGNYEGEFGTKNDDLIFHFWPWKYHEAQRAGTKLPVFNKNFGTLLLKALAVSFSTNITTDYDADMGSWFVKCEGVGQKTFVRELAIKVCEELHKLMSKS